MFVGYLFRNLLTGCTPLRGSQPPETSGCAGPLPMEYGGISPEPPAALKSLSDFAKCKVPGPGRSADADLSAAGPSLLRSCPEGKVPPNRGLQGFENKPACWLRFPEAAAVSTTEADGVIRLVGSVSLHNAGHTKIVSMIKPASMQCWSSRRPSTTKRPRSRRAEDFCCSARSCLTFGFEGEVMTSGITRPAVPCFLS